jgi:hypothetical protein
MSTVYFVLSTVCCLLSTVYCLPPATCCLQFAVSCSPHNLSQINSWDPKSQSPLTNSTVVQDSQKVPSLLSVCGLPSIMCCLLSAVCCVPCALRCVLSAVCSLCDYVECGDPKSQSPLTNSIVVQDSQKVFCLPSVCCQSAVCPFLSVVCSQLSAVCCVLCTMCFALCAVCCLYHYVEDPEVTVTTHKLFCGAGQSKGTLSVCYLLSVRCLPYDICCLLSAVCCVLCALCCVMSDVCCLLSV